MLAMGFLGIPVLILSTIMVQDSRGNAEFTTLLYGGERATFSIWILPLLGLFAWFLSLGVGLFLATTAVGRKDYLALTLWWSGIAIEFLCLVVILSYL